MSFSTPRRPLLPPPVALPSPEDLEAARQRELMRQRRRRGRRATILTRGGFEEATVERKSLLGQ